jgi:ribosomal protein S12 methylthiotransferase
MPKGKTDKRKPRAPIVAAVSLGCPNNTVDTEVMLGALAVAGCDFAADPESADIIIVNTCAFIKPAAEESASVIGEMAELKRARPEATLVVAGCLAQKERAALLDSFPEIDLLIGTSSYPKIVELLQRSSSSHFAKTTFIHNHTHPRLLATPPWTAYLKIAEGCSNRCSYCAIPRLRGPFRSRTSASVLREAADLAAIGVRELVLVAQDTTRFGSTASKPGALPELMQRLADIEGIEWIRVMYAYPDLVDERLAKAIASNPKVCRYIDLPVQHIDNAILKAMNRRGGAAAVKRSISLLRSAVPDISIRSSVIVGFPGETETRFRRLLDFIAEARFDKLGAFAYSLETGTPAASMKNAVPEEIKAERLATVMELQQKISCKKNRELRGKTLKLLVENTLKPLKSAGKNRVALSSGRSERDAPEIDGIVRFDGEAPLGTFVNVKITRSDEYDLFGKLIV